MGAVIGAHVGRNDVANASTRPPSEPKIMAAPYIVGSATVQIKPALNVVSTSSRSVLVAVPVMVIGMLPAELPRSASMARERNAGLVDCMGRMVRREAFSLILHHEPEGIPSRGAARRRVSARAGTD